MKWITDFIERLFENLKDIPVPDMQDELTRCIYSESLHDHMG